MREAETKAQTLEGDDHKQWSVWYTILEEEAPTGHFGCMHYGIRIEKQDGEWDEVRDITTSQSRIEELFELLWRNGVTPMSLREILEDWL
jgi:hypothetical protein